MPLWQSMQVLPFCMAVRCCWRARGFCRSGFMVLQSWQLRHSRESVDFMAFHTRLAMVRRWASNFSGVETVPRILCSTSLLAWILRTILCIQGRGTWQSGQPARTPLRLASWMVPTYSR
jgi:hypothetical protein